jgi:glutamine amidotransferase
LAMNPKMIVIVNYGMGNIGSVANALSYLGAKHFVSNSEQDLRRADALILPGVGAFGAAMENLKKLGLVEELTDQVLFKRKPFLGICLGMQLLAKDSVEQGFFIGLGWVDGHVLNLHPSDSFRVPHVGWNSVTIVRENPLFQKIEEKAHFYFDHSYHFQSNEDIISAICEYGGTYAAAIQKGNIFATQFHPEKSQRNGLKLLRNFLNFINGH